MEEEEEEEEEEERSRRFSRSEVQGGVRRSEGSDLRFGSSVLVPVLDHAAAAAR